MTLMTERVTMVLLKTTPTQTFNHINESLQRHVETKVITVLSPKVKPKIPQELLTGSFFR